MAFLCKLCYKSGTSIMQNKQQCRGRVVCMFPCKYANNFTQSNTILCQIELTGLIQCRHLIVLITPSLNSQQKCFLNKDFVSCKVMHVSFTLIYQAGYHHNSSWLCCEAHDKEMFRLCSIHDTEIWTWLQRHNSHDEGFC